MGNENKSLYEPILEDLNSRDVEVKIEAIAALGILRRPEHAGILKDLLASPDSQVVEAALTALGHIGNPASAKYIFEVLADPRAPLAEKAAGVLQLFPSSEILDGVIKTIAGDHPPLIRKKLISLLAGEKEPRVQAIMTEILSQSQDAGLLQEALTYFVRFPAAEKKTLIQNHARSGQWEIAMLANIALAHLQDEGACTQLRKMIKSPAHPLRLGLVQGLNRAPGIEDRPLYEIFFEDSHPQIRILSLQGLPLFAPEERRTHLKAWFHREKDEMVRRELLATIQKENDPAFLSEYLELLAAPSDEVKALGRRAIAALGESVLPKLLTLFETASLVLREQLVIIFGVIGHREGLKTLAKCLDTKDRWLKLNSIEALAKKGAKKLVPKFTDMLAAEEDVWIRATLLTAIGSLGDSSQIPLFQENLRHPDARVRANAIEGMTRLGDPTVRPFLEKYLRDPNDRVRVNAAIGLWKLGDTHVVEELIKMTRDSSKWMKASSAFALGEIGAFPATPALLELLGTNEDVVYRNALEALAKIGDARALRPLMREKHARKIPEEAFQRLFEEFVQKLG